MGDEHELRSGRSGASRTSSTRTRPRSASARARRGHGSAASSPMAAARRRPRTRTSGGTTRTVRNSRTSRRCSTMPAPGSPDRVGRGGAHCSQARRRGRRVSNTKLPPARSAPWIPRASPTRRLVVNTWATLPVIVATSTGSRSAGRHGCVADDPPHPLGGNLGSGDIERSTRRVHADDPLAHGPPAERERTRCRSRRPARTAHRIPRRWRRTRRGRPRAVDDVVDRRQAGEREQPVRRRLRHDRPGGRCPREGLGPFEGIMRPAPDDVGSATDAAHDPGPALAPQHGTGACGPTRTRLR